MNYAVIGAGGVGGCIGALLAEHGKDVTLIDRGKHLEEMEINGLQMESGRRGRYGIYSVKVSAPEDYSGKPDLILVCVKAFSLGETIPFLERIASPGTVIFPLSSMYGTEELIQSRIPEALVCGAYPELAAYIRKPGTIFMESPGVNIVLGPARPGDDHPVLDTIAGDLRSAGIDTIITENIRKESLGNFFFNSALSLCSVLFHCGVREIRQPGKQRELFTSLIRETAALGDAMGFDSGTGYMKMQMAKLDAAGQYTSTALQRDIESGKASELDSLVFEAVRMASHYRVSMPCYSEYAGILGFKSSETNRDSLDAMFMA